MPDARASIEKHYGLDGLADRIMAALEAAGHDTANLTVEMPVRLGTVRAR